MIVCFPSHSLDSSSILDDDSKPVAGDIYGGAAEQKADDDLYGSSAQAANADDDLYS
jgi:hypothetical protein